MLNQKIATALGGGARNIYTSITSISLGMLVPNSRD